MARCVWDTDGALPFDPDAPVQAVLRRIVVPFADRGTVGGRLRSLARHDVRLGVRVRAGPGKGQRVWRRPTRAPLQTRLKDPLDAGADVYARRQMNRRRYQPAQPHSGRVVVGARSDWHALLPQRCRASRSWEPSARQGARVAANQNRAATRRAVRQGAALVAGLVVCGRCGNRRGVQYQHAQGRPTPCPPTPCPDDCGAQSNR